ncbi:MAG: hypothetical protein KDC66_15235 [Phaeodactylibacter sp.]|nr:hypothetical protein [Phaeodactylibacter sp.]MCB9275811.1 hypothetical protein [Lewinellaceae bacterium]
MKQTFAFSTAITALFFLISCGTPPTEKDGAQQAGTDTEQIAKDWDAAKEAYHDVMSSTFHPAEEGDLEPLKARYSELASAAKQWAALPLPENMKNKGMEELLQKLATDSEAIGAAVTSGSDEAITTAITALHEVFHKIVGLCED